MNDKKSLVEYIPNAIAALEIRFAIERAKNQQSRLWRIQYGKERRAKELVEQKKAVKQEKKDQ